MKRIVTFLKAALLALCAAPAWAQNTADMVRVEVLPGWRAADGSHYAALRLDLAPGWKTYWRSPGEAGVPPQFSWRGSQNLRGVQVIWPSPKPVPQFGYMTIGYDRDVVVPLKVRTRTSGDVELQGQLEIGVCKDICVPVSVDVAQRLASGVTAPDPAIVAALTERPYAASEAGVTGVACRLSPVRDGVELTATISMPRLGGKEVAVVESGDPKVWVSSPATTRQGGQIVARTVLQHVDGRSFAVDRNGLRFTVLGGGRAVDIQGCSAG
ncbi:MAG: protein-disulfide reductase DsbD domain-containing protein [Roseovarius sp.]